jgi:hypothetical protein
MCAIYKLYDEHGVMKFVKFIGLRWAEYVMRMDEWESAKQVLCTKPAGIGDGKEADQG